MPQLLGAERGDAWLSRGPAMARCITGVAGVGLPCPERMGAGVLNRDMGEVGTQPMPLSASLLSSLSGPGLGSFLL